MVFRIKKNILRKAAKFLADYLKTPSFFKVKESYNSEFVEKIKKAELEEGELMVIAKDLWESI